MAVPSGSENPLNIILTGFMGTGKTSVGREVARRLGRPFIDMDAEIEARTGKSIPAIFAEEGEAHFRNLEAGLCRELSARRGLVIATGGGTLVNEENRRLMSSGGLVICLTCWTLTVPSCTTMPGPVTCPPSIRMCPMN